MATPPLWIPNQQENNAMLASAADCFFISLADGRRVSLLKPSIMGIINMSPDSFYRPYDGVDQALTAVAEMVNSGADIIDIGGEATNLAINLQDTPSTQQQIDRVAPLIEMVSKRFDVLLSVDTSLPAVMREAVRCGAHLVNDQRALQMPDALATVAQLGVPVCLMHFFSEPRTPGSTTPSALLTQIKTDLQQRVANCLAAGISPERIILDPGFGQGNYGKNSPENYYLLSRLSELTALGLPLLVGWSRKSMIGDALGVPPAQRLFGSIAAATIAAMQGAAIIRVHDVAQTVDAIKIVRMVQQV